jgi:hypothetical protein
LMSQTTKNIKELEVGSWEEDEDQQDEKNMKKRMKKKKNEEKKKRIYILYIIASTHPRRLSAATNGPIRTSSFFSKKNKFDFNQKIKPNNKNKSFLKW